MDSPSTGTKSKSKSMDADPMVPMEDVSKRLKFARVTDSHTYTQLGQRDPSIYSFQRQLSISEPAPAPLTLKVITSLTTDLDRLAVRTVALLLH